MNATVQGPSFGNDDIELLLCVVTYYGLAFLASLTAAVLVRATNTKRCVTPTSPLLYNPGEQCQRKERKRNIYKFLFAK